MMAAEVDDEGLAWIVDFKGEEERQPGRGTKCA